MMIKKTILLLCSILLIQSSFATIYYFSANGKNTNSGLSKEAPFKHLDKISTLSLKAGDQVLLKKGDIFYGSIKLISLNGTVKKPIIISSYGEGDKKPLINAKGKLNGVFITDCNHIEVKNIEITANGGSIENYDSTIRYLRCGVFITTSKKGNYTGFRLENLHIREIYFEEKGFIRGKDEVLTGNGTQKYGWGIRVINSHKNNILSDIIISQCHIKNVSHSGIRFTGNHSLSTQKEKNIQKVRVYDNKLDMIGGPGLQASVVDDIVFRGNDVNHTGSADDSRKWGRGSGLWVWGCNGALIEYNSFRNANGPGDSAGSHIDFNNKNVIIQYNLSENNAGGFVEILGNNYNCAYRYNVSINDGSRTKIEGKTLGAGTMIGVNGFIGFGKTPLGPFNCYIYNNTIFANDSIHPEVGFSKRTKGILIMNNIIYLKGKATYDHRKQFLPESGSIDHVVFTNNLFLKTDNWPESSKVMISDNAPLYGDPLFVNAGGIQIQDYTPQNKKLIQNKSIDIPYIPTDSIGLIGGFTVKKDILGNKIKKQPDMGAIEIK